MKCHAILPVLTRFGCCGSLVCAFGPTHSALRELKGFSPRFLDSAEDIAAGEREPTLGLLEDCHRYYNGDTPGRFFPAASVKVRRACEPPPVPTSQSERACFDKFHIKCPGSPSDDSSDMARCMTLLPVCCPDRFVSVCDTTAPRTVLWRPRTAAAPDSDQRNRCKLCRWHWLRQCRRRYRSTR